MEKNETKYVPWLVFVWAMGIFIVIIGWILYGYSALSADVQQYNVDIAKINVQLSQIQNDLSWIKIELQKQYEKTR